MRTWDEQLKYGFSTPYLKVGTDDGHNFFLLEGFKYTAKNGQEVLATPDFSSDGASTPSLLWSVIPPFGKYWMAAVLHDVCYRFLQLPKDRCDDLLKEAMELLEVPKVIAHPIYEGVHLFGWNSFNEDRILQMKGGQ